MKLSYPRLVALAILLAIGGWLGVLAADTYAISRLRTRLDASRRAERFPAEYFRAEIPDGASPRTVCERMRAYDEVRYYLVALAGGPDSVVVQQFIYPLAVTSLAVGVEYRSGRVAEVDTERIGMNHARRINAKEARSRLGMRSVPAEHEHQGCP